MATKEKRQKKQQYEEEDFVEESLLARWFGADSEHVVFSIASFLATFFFVLAALDRAGLAGSYAYSLAGRALGVSFPVLPLTTAILGISFLKNHRSAKSILAAGALFFVALSGIGPLMAPDGAGGIAGDAIAGTLMKVFGPYLAAVILVLASFLALSILADLNLGAAWASVKVWWASRGAKPLGDELYPVYGADALGTVPENAPSTPSDGAAETETENGASVAAAEAASTGQNEDESPLRTIRPRRFRSYTPPPLSLLEKDNGKPGVGDIKANANLIKRTLANFGINVEMDEVSIGPAITRYALKPAEGVKLSRIVNLQDNLALALAAHPLRIEAPIPGKSLVGIEIPNSTRTTVGLGTLLGHKDFEQLGKILPFALGRGISGNVFFADLSHAPHLLIAGATGSGKSVTIHCIIASLLYRHGPENLRFIMVDPKRVELTLYNSIPHLLSPVITDPKKAILSLKWAAKEMERRYDILEAKAVRDIKSYHANIVSQSPKERDGEGPDPMPYIVIVIDELADLMAAYPRELEAAVVRLAQKSRAVGIHLLISTQRPSIEVITGLIKANIPARIALQVPSQIDSRTIIDMPGAEKLLGAGDMLYLAADMAKPQRIQSAFLTEKEVKRIVDHIRAHTETPDDRLAFSDPNGGAAEPTVTVDFMASDENAEEDDFYEEARALVVEAGKASTSYLQRRLKVGYARAARLIDMLEERGVVGPGEGSKPREVYGRSPGAEGGSDGDANEGA